MSIHLTQMSFGHILEIVAAENSVMWKCLNYLCIFQPALITMYDKPCVQKKDDGGMIFFLMLTDQNIITFLELTTELLRNNSEEVCRTQSLRQDAVEYILGVFGKIPQMFSLCRQQDIMQQWKYNTIIDENLDVFLRQHCSMLTQFKKDFEEFKHFYTNNSETMPGFAVLNEATVVIQFRSRQEDYELRLFTDDGGTNIETSEVVTFPLEDASNPPRTISEDTWQAIQKKAEEMLDKHYYPTPDWMFDVVLCQQRSGDTEFFMFKK